MDYSYDYGDILAENGLSFTPSIIGNRSADSYVVRKDGAKIGYVSVVFHDSAPPSAFFKPYSEIRLNLPNEEEVLKAFYKVRTNFAPKQTG